MKVKKSYIRRVNIQPVRIEETSIFGIVCTRCDTLVLCPFNNTPFWDHSHVLIRKNVDCQNCGLLIKVGKGYRIISEGEEDG